MPLPLKGRLGKIAYGMGTFGQTGFMQLTGAWLLVFLIDEVHLDPWLAGLIFLISYGVWNGVNDPIIGDLSDRTQTRVGRRRPYILIGLPLMFLFNILIWSLPLGGEPLANPHSLPIFFYALIIIAVYELGYTMATTGHSAVFPEMWPSVEERSEVTVYGQILAVVGGALAMVVFPLLVEVFSEQRGTFAGWTWASGVMAAVFAGGFSLCLLAIKERKEFTLDNPLPLVESLKTAFTNKSFITYAGVNLMTYCTFDWLSAMYPFFIIHSLGLDMEATSVVMGAQLVGTFISFAIWRKICISHGTKVTIAASMITFSLSFTLVLVVRNVQEAAVMGFLGGATVAGLLMARMLMIADVIDEDETKTGVRREGIYMGGRTATNKISLVIVGAGTALLLSTIIGYVPGQPDPPFMDMGIRLGMIGFAAIFTVILLLFLRFYPLGKERVEEVSKQIEKIHAEKAKKLERA